MKNFYTPASARSLVLNAEKEWDLVVDAPVFGLVADFPDARKELAEHEGGNDDDPADPGGRTSRGILQTEYDRYRARKGMPPRDVWKASDSEVDEIYKTEYWDKMRCDELPAGVDYAVFDYGVNSGVKRAANVLQRHVGAGIDGDIGTETLGKAKAADPIRLINDICDERMAFLRGLKTFGRFGNGWTRRVSDVRALSLNMAKNAPAVVPQSSGGWIAALIGAVLAMFRGASPKPAPAPVPPHPASVDQAWMRWAAKEVGFHETGQNRNIGRYTGPAQCGSEGDPWCAIFVNAALESSGIRGTRSAMARSFEDHPEFVRLPEPSFGCITTMWRGSPSSGSGHVFFYVGHLDSSRVLALGGNQSDQVCRQAEPVNRIVGYWWPKSVPLPKIGKISVNNDAKEGDET